MDQVIERLRVSQERSFGEKYKSGEEVGRTWASEEAEADELFLLDKFQQHHLQEGDDLLESEKDPSALLYFSFRPENRGKAPAAKAFWEKLLGNRSHLAEHTAFLRGFVEGALTILDHFNENG